MELTSREEVISEKLQELKKRAGSHSPNVNTLIEKIPENDDEWKPTSTSFGSTVDFVTFLEQWRTYIMETFKKLNINTGAFYFAWDNDNLDTKPLVLEVSSSYSPNPKVNLDSKMSYDDYKHTIKYNHEYVKIMYEIQDGYVKTCLARNN